MVQRFTPVVNHMEQIRTGMALAAAIKDWIGPKEGRAASTPSSLRARKPWWPGLTGQRRAGRGRLLGEACWKARHDGGPCCVYAEFSGERGPGVSAAFPWRQRARPSRTYAGSTSVTCHRTPRSLNSALGACSLIVAKTGPHYQHHHQHHGGETPAGSLSSRFEGSSTVPRRLVSGPPGPQEGPPGPQEGLPLFGLTTPLLFV